MTLVACQPAPTPFAHTPGQGDSIISERPDIAGVTVRPINGVTKRQSDALSKAMVNAFMAMEIPAATTGKNRRSRFVDGTAKIISSAKTQIAIQIEWTLTDSLGRALETHKSRHRINRESWNHPNPKSLSSWAKQPAQQFSRRILGPLPNEKRSQSVSLPRLHVWPVDGIDGSRATTLQRAMERALSQRKFVVLKGLEGAALIIAGSVSLGTARGGSQPIEINWSVLDTKGKQVGKLDQKNSVAVSTIKNRWQNLSSIITQNAAGGVSEIVYRLPVESFPQDKKTRR
jgi:hypothetical protein